MQPSAEDFENLENRSTQPKAIRARTLEAGERRTYEAEIALLGFNLSQKRHPFPKAESTPT